MIFRPLSTIVRSALVSVLAAGTLAVPMAAAAAPANDDRASATPIEVLPFESSTSNEGATEEITENRICNEAGLYPMGATIWYRYAPQADEKIVIDSSDSEIPTVLAVYDGENPLPLACSSADEDFRTKVTVDVEAGTTYSIQIGGVRGTTGPITLRATVPDMPVSPPSGSVDDRPVTVVAVVDAGFSPYHYDFVGHQHPWNADADPTNDFDFFADPASYVEGHPGAAAVPITIPTSPAQNVSLLRDGPDEAAWETVEESPSATEASLYWFPGTKVIGAVSFDDDLYGSNASHGTRSAASAVGNIHGTCPTCLVVFVKGFTHDALAWAASQPWIDVVTNSYGHSTGLRDNIYFDAPLDATRQASEDGGTIVFSAGNGHANAFVAPPLTYWSSEKGPDWIVTVGAVTPDGKQSFSGHGKPVDVSSVGRRYPSTGGSTATGEGTHSGTSNAAPTVAGYFGSVIQGVRDRLGDVTAGRSEGIVASGGPAACGEAVPDCALSDGVLTKVELDRLVYTGALPSELDVDTNSVPWWPSTEYAYAYQGHGVLAGHLSDAGFESEIDRMLAVATGDVAPYERPTGEENWFIVDSKCRQRLWGEWSGGSFNGTEPNLDPLTDPLATTFDAWCSQLPQGPYAN